ncbi:MAG: hypothetical protein JJT95_03690 [Pararhodobacter sp.]|nr:hypothetical protein [Pararhodobacter sp.]
MRLPPAATLAAAALLLLTPAHAPAQVISECGWVGSPANIVEPWEENSRSFANGAIRIALLDTGGEPVCCARHLLILAPSGHEEGPVYRQCMVASAQEGSGFFEIDFDLLVASYDPEFGLLIDMQLWHYVVDGGSPIPDRMQIRINQATGAVDIEFP